MNMVVTMGVLIVVTMPSGVTAGRSARRSRV